MRRNSGFSLVELIVGLGIGVLFFTAIVPLLMRATDILREAYQTKKAYVLAENEIEYLVAPASPRLENGKRGFTAASKSDLSGLWNAVGTVCIADYPQARGLKTIEVSLCWSVEKNRRKLITLTTLKK